MSRDLGNRIVRRKLRAPRPQARGALALAFVIARRLPTTFKGLMLSAASAAPALGSRRGGRYLRDKLNAETGSAPGGATS
jgi:hypothetical protein